MKPQTDTSSDPRQSHPHWYWLERARLSLHFTRWGLSLAWRVIREETRARLIDPLLRKNPNG